MNVAAKKNWEASNGCDYVLNSPNQRGRNREGETEGVSVALPHRGEG